MRELDVLLSRWLDQHHATASPELQQAFVELLGCEDDQIWDWLLDREVPPAQLQALVQAIQRSSASGSDATE
ncbi:MAG: succinate dehydrogenase assembly factor 2 [Wenzhouxiangellaceae bacterium]|nr:MAG: succinate dehydrogenase assembly factor 2 [Wenzhouxiangellaceae bacterium]